MAGAGFDPTQTRQSKDQITTTDIPSLNRGGLPRTLPEPAVQVHSADQAANLFSSGIAERRTQGLISQENLFATLPNRIGIVLGKDANGDPKRELSQKLPDGSLLTILHTPKNPSERHSNDTLTVTRVPSVDNLKAGHSTNTCEIKLDAKGYASLVTVKQFSSKTGKDIRLDIDTQKALAVDLNVLLATKIELDAAAKKEASQVVGPQPQKTPLINIELAPPKTINEPSVIKPEALSSLQKRYDDICKKDLESETKALNANGVPIATELAKELYLRGQKGCMHAILDGAVMGSPAEKQFCLAFVNSLKGDQKKDYIQTLLDNSSFVESIGQPSKELNTEIKRVFNQSKDGFIKTVLELGKNNVLSDEVLQIIGAELKNKKDFTKNLEDNLRKGTAFEKCNAIHLIQNLHLTSMKAELQAVVASPQAMKDESVRSAAVEALLYFREPNGPKQLNHLVQRNLSISEKMIDSLHELKTPLEKQILSSYIDKIQNNPERLTQEADESGMKALANVPPSYYAAIRNLASIKDVLDNPKALHCLAQAAILLRNTPDDVAELLAPMISSMSEEGKDIFAKQMDIEARALGLKEDPEPAQSPLGSPVREA